MNFAAFETDITARLHAYGVTSTEPPPVAAQDAVKVRRVMAACALTIAQRGEIWCREHPAAFVDLVKSNLGMFLGLVLTIVGLFTGGGVWLTLLRWIVPAVIDWLNSRRVFAYGHNPDLTQLGHEARLILKAV